MAAFHVVSGDLEAIKNDDTFLSAFQRNCIKTGQKSGDK